VEGTLVSCAARTEQLIPYARAHFEGFLRNGIAGLERKGGDLDADDLDADSLFHDLALLQAENHAESDPTAPRIRPHRAVTSQRTGTDPSEAIPEILSYIEWLTGRDKNSVALKSLQGKIWKSGFESGELKLELFGDVPRAFARWSSHARIAIYSSGSVSAQRALFSRSSYGDLSRFVTAYFDTRTGSKTDGRSYVASPRKCSWPHRNCVFSPIRRANSMRRGAPVWALALSAVPVMPLSQSRTTWLFSRWMRHRRATPVCHRKPRGRLLRHVVCKDHAGCQTWTSRRKWILPVPF